MPIVPPASTFIVRPSGRAASQVVLLVPGLNNRSEAMQPVIEVLNTHGYDCVCVQLRFGQRLSSDAIATDWVSAITDAYAACRAQYADRNIHSVSFSLGGLITLGFLQRTPSTSLDRLFLIAPPLALTRSARLVRYVTPLRMLGLAIPSLSPRRIRARAFTTLADYHAMLILADELNRVSLGDNIRRARGSVILNVDDEFVDATGVSDWVRRKGLDWNVRLLSKGPVRWGPRHLMLSELSMGQEAWYVLTREMIAHLTQPSHPAGHAPSSHRTARPPQ